MTKLTSEKLVVLPKRLEMGSNYAVVGQANGLVQAMAGALVAGQFAAQGNLAAITQFSWF